MSVLCVRGSFYIRLVWHLLHLCLTCIRIHRHVLFSCVTHIRQIGLERCFIRSRDFITGLLDLRWVSHLMESLHLFKFVFCCISSLRFFETTMVFGHTFFVSLVSRQNKDLIEPSIKDRFDLVRTLKIWCFEVLSLLFSGQIFCKGVDRSKIRTSSEVFFFSCSLFGQAF